MLITTNIISITIIVSVIILTTIIAIAISTITTFSKVTQNNHLAMLMPLYY